MAQLFTLPYVPALSLQAQIMGASRLYFYLTETTTTATIYADPDLANTLPNPVIADAYGRFEPVYLDDNIIYRVRLTDLNDAQIGTDIDGVNATAVALSGTIAGLAGEIANRVAADAALDGRLVEAESNIGALQNSVASGILQYATWAEASAQFQPYASGTTYSKGDSAVDQNTLWTYINDTASAGHAPPTLPATSDDYWQVLSSNPYTITVQVPDTDDGTHTDPTDGTADTPNSGVFRYATGDSGTGLKYIAPTPASQAKPYADAAAASATDAAASAASIAGVTNQVEYHSLLEADRGSDQFIGRPDGAALAGTSGTANYTFVFADPIAHDGALQEVDLYSLSASPFDLQFALYTLAGNTFTQVDGSASSVTIPGASGSGESLSVFLLLANAAGYYLGFCAPANCISYKSATPADGLGYYQSSGTGLQTSFTRTSALTTVQIQIRFKQGYSNVNSALVDQVSANALSAALVDASFPKEDQRLYTNPELGSFPPSGNFSVFGFGVDCGPQLERGPVDGELLYLYVAPTAANLHLQVWLKSTTDPTIDNVPLNATGTLLVDTTVPAVSTGILPGNFGWVTFPYPEQFIIAEGQTLFSKMWATDANDAVVTISSGFGTLFSTQHQRGWYAHDGTTSLQNTITTSGAPSVVFLGQRYQATNATLNYWSERDLVSSCTGEAATLTMTISGTLMRDNQPFTFSGSVTHGAAPTGTASNVTANRAGGTLMLIYASGNPTGYAAASPTGYLPNTNISALVLKKVSDGSTLTLDTDFVLNPDHGVIGLKPNASAYAVSATYNWAKVRYDLIVLNPETLALSIAAGTARDWDVAEYLPKPSASTQIPLFYVRVVGSAITRIIPLWDIENGARRSFLPDIIEQNRLNRAALRNTLGRLARGTPFPLVGYGDSETAIQSNTPSNTVANGQVRDRATNSGYLGAAQQSDTIATVPLYDFGDGAGQVHTKLGWNWSLIKALGAFGWVGTYQNMGVAGTTSDTNPNNGRDPTRLAAAVGYATDGLVVLAFGQNELVGGVDTEGNAIAMIRAFQAVGADVIVMGVTRPNAYRGAGGWYTTNRALERAARFCGAAFCSMLNVANDDQLGVIGLDPIEMSAANLYNHPGIHEMNDVYGPALVRAVLGE